MVKKTIYLAVTLGLIPFLQMGCATIVAGRHQDITVMTSPPGATATVEGTSITTPGKFTLRRDSDHIINITKDSYQPQSVKITSAFSGASGAGGAIVGNLLLVGIFMPVLWGIDAASGAQYALYPDTVNITLSPTGSSPPPTMMEKPPEKAGERQK